ncbi:hypothetical protein BMS3Bbin14_00350 [bacterium BMS3Bbin14]|nr:hypothetical protein BMS3Abin13_00112 [bacterium BMS3Abin13]GBE51892.1 hypothetical protein BMS3Bbin14_00350 [bacterium BMS3Bbin14]HDL98870.1 class I SAM-dependent methyltransferase [Desulfobacteraceae bacterium]
MKEKGGIFIVLLNVIGRLIPGTYLRTFVYLNGIAATRKFLRKSIGSFYRMDHIYDVLKEFKKHYRGNFSILEFGVADGYSFTKKLYAVRYLKMEDHIKVHGFDTFTGLPDKTSSADNSLVAGGEWREGHYKGRYDNLTKYCRSKYKNFKLHKGLFEETITDDFLETLAEQPPILIWIDCDYYSSTKVIFEKLIPYIPTGCVIYFDDIYFNFSSRFTGEMKAVWEVNQGEFGEGIELVLDSALSWDSNRVYRFININQKKSYELIAPVKEDPVRRRRDDSPLP